MISNCDEARRNGGPAFPWGTGFQGMTLRDHFATQALTSLILPSDMSSSNKAYQHMANRAYEMADAMLKAREQ